MGRISQAKKTPQANFRTGRDRGQALRMETSREGYWGSDHRGPYCQMGQIRLNSTRNAGHERMWVPAVSYQCVRAAALGVAWGPTAVASGWKQGRADGCCASTSRGWGPD